MESTLIASPWLDSLFASANVPLILLDPHGQVIRKSPLVTVEDSIDCTVGEPLEIPPWGLFMPLAIEGKILLMGSGSEEEHRKSQFLTFATHELRTPTSVIQSWAELLQKGMLRTPEERAEAYRILHSESARLSGMLSKILHFFRLVSGNLPMEFRSLSVDQLIQKVALDIQPRADEKGITLFVENDFPSLQLEGDLNALNVAFSAVLENAIQASKSNQDIFLQVHDEGSLLTFTIIDQGEGIPEELMADLFRPFHPVDNKNRALHGIGVGLPTTKMILDAHHGTIHINSSKAGTQVTISFPRLASPFL